MSVAIIFGGTGFIGSYFSAELIESHFYRRVYLFDLKPVCDLRFLPFLKKYIDDKRIVYQYCDVRTFIADQVIIKDGDDISLVANFAAIHREPGHANQEYYETNLLGAENITQWADIVGCKDIIFTSSIAPYGPSETPKNEQSLPAPVSAYGSSKLAAEKIHISWQVEDKENKHLTIVRPGVVFGAGEGGNVSRLIRAVLGRYFFYMGNKNTRKAGTYVKELCHAMYWVHKTSRDHSKVRLFNMTMSPGPSMQEYVKTICKVAGVKRIIPSIPFMILYPLSCFIHTVARMARIDQPINPVRIKKLSRSNNILPDYLEQNEYKYRYTLRAALEDWKQQMPSEWNNDR